MNSNRKIGKIAFSRPVTCRTEEHPYIEIDNESISIGSRINEVIQRLRVESPDVFVCGRFSERLAFYRGIKKTFIPRFLMRERFKMIMLDNEWHCRYRDSYYWHMIFRREVGKIYKRLVAKGVSYLQVFTEAEADNYAQFYGIDRKKFVFIPFCSRLDKTSFPRSRGDYLFTGGLHDRDYMTLFAAVRDLPITLRIAAPKEHFDAADVPSNVQLLGRIPPNEYYLQIAASRAVILSLEYSSLRFPGIITYVEAMRMGKAVIVNDPLGAKDYISNRETGLLIPNKDPLAMKEAIVELCDDAVFTERLEENAFIYAKENLGYDRYFADINRLIERVMSEGVQK